MDCDLVACGFDVVLDDFRPRSVVEVAEFIDEFLCFEVRVPEEPADHVCPQVCEFGQSL